MLMSALAFASLAWLNTAWSADHGIVCQDCASAELESCALVTAMQLGLSHNDQVWVLDLNNLNAERFRVLGTGPGQDPHSEAGSHSATIRAVDNVEPIGFTASQQEYVVDGMHFVRDVVLPSGGQIYRQCHQSQQGNFVLETTPVLQGGAPIVRTITVPPSVYGSAYDLVGYPAASRSLGQWWAQQDPARNFFGQAADLAGNFISASLVDYELVLKFKFADGSSGIWRTDPYSDAWEADFDTFKDSDGNPVPVDNIPAGSRYFFSGEAPGGDNLQNFLDRAAMLGIPITGPDGGGLPTECEVTPGGLRCRPASDPY